MLPLLWSLTSALAAPAQAPNALIVWMQPTAPGEEVIKVAERATGGAQHRAWSDVAFTAEPVSSTDEQRLSALGTVLKEGRARWEEFESEAGVARALASAVDPIDVLGDTSQRDQLRTALIWEGAGITRGYPDALFPSLQDTAPFRVSIAGKSAVRPWVDAIALEPKHVFERADFPDGQSFTKVLALQSELALLPPGRLTIDPLPPGCQVFLDGVGVPVESRSVELSSGHHYAHVVVNGVVAERMEFDSAPNDTVSLKPAISPEVLASAAASVALGSAEVPPDMATAVRSLAGRIGGELRVFLGTLDEKGRPQLVAFSGGAVIQKKRPVTLLLVGELGGGVLQSSGFSGAKGSEQTTYQFGGSLGLELGIYNAALFASADLALAPAVQMAFGSDGGTTPEDNEQTSAFFRPNGGVGVYLPRPLPGKVFFLLGGTYGWFAPASMGPGAKLSVGIPLKNDGQTWLRLTIDLYRGTQFDDFVAPGTPTSMASFRVGFGSGF